MSARETTLVGQAILSISGSTPYGMDFEIRESRRRQVNISLSRNNQVDIFINEVELSQVMVGRVTDQLSCLFAGHAAIDITPLAAAELDIWLGKRLRAISA